MELGEDDSSSRCRPVERRRQVARVVGLDGDDEVFTIAGADTVSLGAGNDVAELGSGNDAASGGDGDDDVVADIRAHVARRIGKLARPKRIIWAEDLPKTRSGKIMRRLLRDIAEGRALGDTTTLADAGVVDTIRERSGATEEE